MIELRETSYRRIQQVLHRPEIREAWRLDGWDLPPIGEAFHYLHCGDGFVLYMVRGTLAHMHGALTPGDGRQAARLWPAHLAYLRALGVTRITTRHRADHKRASLMCRGLGFEPVPCDDGFKRYEKVIHG